MEAPTENTKSGRQSHPQTKSPTKGQQNKESHSQEIRSHPLPQRDNSSPPRERETHTGGKLPDNHTQEKRGNPIKEETIHTEEYTQITQDLEIEQLTWQEQEQDDQIDHNSQTHIRWATEEEIKTIEEINPGIELCKQVREKGYPNRWGARIPVSTKWNLGLFERLLQGYHDIEIIEWMTYGWPIGRLPTLEDPEITFKNHKGATEHPQALEQYINKEQKYDAVLGPFEVIPFTQYVGISPLSTRPKKESTERRVILDLSFPPERSVNDGIKKDNYLGFHAKLTFPKTDQLAARVFFLGKGTKLYKVDLHRYFRQLNLDPGDYSLVGYVIGGKLYFDKMVPMGVRTGPYVAQRVSSAIAWIVHQLQYYLLNYVDDFVGAEIQEKAWAAFHFLTNLLRDLNVQTSPEKVVPPTTRLEFLGTTFDSEKMSMEVPQSKLQEIKEELSSWEEKQEVTRREIESLIGKLQFAARCVRAGRLFLSRLLNWLRETNRQDTHKIPPEARKDIGWWRKFMEKYNGVSIIWLHTVPRTDALMATDACLQGYGGISGEEYFRGEFPQEWKNKNIATLELLAVLVGLRKWKNKFRGRYFWIHVDNEAVATILNTGASRDKQLQDILREIAYLAAQGQFFIKAKHISGVSNRVPDWLSRWKDKGAREAFQAHAKNKNLTQLPLTAQDLYIKTDW